MRVVHARCAGLDVHKKNVVAAVRIHTDSDVTVEVRTFLTTTSGLLELAGWLEEQQVTHAVLEATGVYWKPVWHVVSPVTELTLANAKQVKNLPGRKSDVKDATWLAELHAHGLVRASFVPPTEQLDLRTLVRTRVQLVRERTRHVQRLQKTLEDGNVKLSSYVSDIMGRNSRRVLDAIVAGETDPARLVALMQVRRMKASPTELKEALNGSIREHHRYMLNLHLTQIDQLDEVIDDLERRIDTATAPFRYAEELLVTIPGISHTTAQLILAEVGPTVDSFKSAAHLVSWARLCPRSDSSAGKHRSRRIMKGSNWLKPALVQAAWAAIRVKGSYLRARYYRLKARGGGKKAAIAVAASILVAIYHMLRDGTEYADLGAEHLNTVDEEKYKAALVRKLERFGYDVNLVKKAA